MYDYGNLNNYDEMYRINSSNRPQLSCQVPFQTAHLSLNLQPAEIPRNFTPNANPPVSCVGIPDYIAEVNRPSPRSNYSPRVQQFDSSPSTHSPRGRPTVAIPSSPYGSRNPYQGPPADSNYRAGANASQQGKPKNKSEWNYYLNQAAAVGKNKSATIPSIRVEEESTYNHWGPPNKGLNQGIVFNGVNHVSNTNMRP